MSYVLTLVVDRTATSLGDATIARVRDAIEGAEPVALSPGEAADIPVRAAPDMAAVAAALEGAPVDAIPTRARGPAQGAAGRRHGQHHRHQRDAGRARRLCRSEGADRRHHAAGDERRDSTFAGALRERVAMLKGLPLEALEKTWAETRLTPGARELVATMRAHNATAALVSGGFSFFTGRVAARSGFIRTGPMCCSTTAWR